MDLFKPSVYFSWSVHVDGVGARHDEAVCREGIFDKAVAAIKEAKARGFRVPPTRRSSIAIRRRRSSRRSTISTTSQKSTSCRSLRVTPTRRRPIRRTSSAWSERERSSVKRSATATASGGVSITRRFILDFLEGKVDFACTAWGIPSYSVFGWQRPCYLMSDAPYADSYKELLNETDWSKYGRGRNPKCENCMAHCGYEPTAVLQRPDR